MNRPLPFDPIARAAELWEDSIGPSQTMAAVTGVMRVQQIIQSAVDAALKDLARGKTVSIPDPRYKALAGAVKLVPRGALGGLSSRTGRRYGPQR
jgi:polygalacturonase